MFRLLSILAAAVSVALGSTGIAAMPFTLTQLTDNTTDESASGVQRQIALDDLGRPHIVFIGASPQGYQGVFRAWNPGAWAVHAVAADTTANRSPVLACGSGGVTHVLFSRWNGNFTEVEHVPLFADSAGAWEPAFAGESFESPSLCIGPDGVLHAVCGSYWGTAYGQRTTSGWSPSETIAAGRQASIAVDGLGECHVVYEDVDSTWTSQIWYVHGTRGSWAAPEWLAGGNDLDARNASIAIDASNRVLVAYDQQTTSDHGVELRIRTGGTWSAPEWVGQGIAPALAVGPSGDPYIASWDRWGYSGLLLSYRDAALVWTHVVVDSLARSWGEVTTRPGIAIGADSTVHISYCSRDERGGEDSELWYAHGDVATSVAESPLLRGPRFLSLPNPVAGSVHVRFEVPAASRVWLDLCDVRGRIVAQRALGGRAGGAHVVTWNLGEGRREDIASGVYIIRLRTETGTVAAKVVVAR